MGLLGRGTFASFSAVSDDERYSESKYVELLTGRLPLEKHLVRIGVEDVETQLGQLLDCTEVPFRSLSVIAQHLLYAKVRGETDVKVLLNGQGGDELFGGYSNHYFLLLGILLRRGRIDRLLREGLALSRNRGLGIRPILRISYHQARRADAGWSYFNEQTALEVAEASLREYLAYDDRNSMAHSVEARVPFLDYRIVEFAFSLHPDLKIRDFLNKRVVRRWAEGRLPEAILARRDKMGFTTPQELWQMRGPLREALVEEGSRIRSHRFQGLVADPDVAISRYEAYLDNGGSDWAFAWRTFSLSRWMARVGLV
jgi:asparagine synthase (glutamine-hydrolysing)